MPRSADYLDRPKEAAPSGRAGGAPPVGPPAHDPTEFDHFFQANRTMVYRAVLAECRDRETANDATAEAFARAYKHWPQLAIHPNPLGWVVRTASNVARDARRVASRTRPLSEDDDERAITEPFSDQELLDTLVRHLDERERRVVAMYELVGMRTAEIAEVLGLSRWLVRDLRRRAFAKLRQALGQDEREA